MQLSKSLVEQSLLALSPSDVPFGIVPIADTVERPPAADRDWDFKNNPHYHLPAAAAAIVILYPYQLVRTGRREGRGRLASIGYHADYHKVLEDYLRQLADQLTSRIGQFDYKIFVDKHGLCDVKMAVMAGLGHIGKLSMLLNRQYGTAHNIGYLLTTLKSADPIHFVEDSCDSCNCCERACPNGALSNRKVDVTRCRAAINQKKGALSEGDIANLGEWFYGCDICQYACPHNRHRRVVDGDVDLNEIMQLTKSTFRQYHQKKSYGYLGLARLKRNAMVILYKQRGLSALAKYTEIIGRSPLLAEQYQVLKQLAEKIYDDSMTE